MEDVIQIACWLAGVGTGMAIVMICWLKSEKKKLNSEQNDAVSDTTKAQ